MIDAATAEGDSSRVRARGADRLQRRRVRRAGGAGGESTDSSGVESSKEENSWELAAGGLSTAVAAAAVEEERGTLLESTDSSEAEQGSTDSSEAESRVLSPSEDEWEDLSQADYWSSMEAAVDAVAVASLAEEATAAECLNSVRILAIITERRQREDVVAAAAATATRVSGLEDKEGEGSWKLAARPAPSTLGRHNMIEHK